MKVKNENGGFYLVGNDALVVPFFYLNFISKRAIRESPL